MSNPAFDPTNPEHVHKAMEDLYAKIETLQKARTELSDQNAALQSQVKHLQSSPVSRNAVSAPSRPAAPKLPLPEKYDGKRHQFRQFLNSVKLHFSVSPDRFPSDAAKTGFVSSLLRGPALDWITPYLEMEDSMLSSWMEFESKFKAMFDDPHRSKTAINKLSQLRQGRRSVVAYAAEFRRIIMDADFDNNAKAYWFRTGLSDPILDELVHTTTKTDLDELIAQCILIDTRLLEREVERKRRSLPRVPPSTRPAPINDPMIVDSTATVPRRGPLSSEERKRRIENDLCLYCGKAGHHKSSCPSKSGNGRARQQ